MRRHGPPTDGTRKIPTKWNKVDLKANRSLSPRSYIPNDLVPQKERKKEESSIVYCLIVKSMNFVIKI